MLGNAFRLRCPYSKQVNLSSFCHTANMPNTIARRLYITLSQAYELSTAFEMEPSRDSGKAPACSASIACVPLNKIATCRSTIHLLLTKEGKTCCFKGWGF